MVLYMRGQFLERLSVYIAVALGARIAKELEKPFDRIMRTDVRLDARIAFPSLATKMSRSDASEAR